MKNERSHLSVYESLASLNRHFHEILIELEVVKSLGLLRRALVEEVKASVEETRAWANFEMVDVMYLREEAAWARFSRIRRKLEQRNQNPSSATEPEPSQTPKFERRLQRVKRNKKSRR
jgi:hypothetical protein